MIYFGQSVEDGMIRIGTADDLDRHLRRLKTTYGETYRILGTMDGDREALKAIHDRFARLRLGGGNSGRFRPTPELLAWIEATPQPSLSRGS
jgi:hypothetical protein